MVAIVIVISIIVALLISGITMYVTKLAYSRKDED